MENSVSERLMHIIETREKGNKAAFGRAVGITSQSVADILTTKGGPSFLTLQKILGAYPDINSDWLIMGIGPMLKGQQPEGAGLTSGEATVAESETLLRLAVAEAKLEEKDRQLADKDRLIDKLWQLNGLPEKLGKLMSSSDAALARFFARFGQQVSLVEAA